MIHNVERRGRGREGEGGREGAREREREKKERKKERKKVQNVTTLLVMGDIIFIRQYFVANTLIFSCYMNS